jgi:DNA-binding XRE family transcriptional regulator
MHVYLDESGSFSVPAIQTSSMSVVGALAVPKAKIGEAEKLVQLLETDLAIAATAREPGTQEELADRSGFSQQYISGLEQGRRNPTIVSIYELATALGVSHMELVRPTEER